MDDKELELVRKAWDNGSGNYCGSCSWYPAFSEIEDGIVKEGPGEYWASCVSKDADDPSDHRGHYIYREDA